MAALTAEKGYPDDESRQSSRAPRSQGGLIAMAESAPVSSLIDGRYEVDLAEEMLWAGGGLPAWAAKDRHARGQRDGAPALMAQRVGRHAPTRARALQALANGIGGMCTPLAQGLGAVVDGHAAWFVICEAPQGPPVSANLQPWPETMLIERVLRPAAAVLDALRTRGLTHRAIRPNNVFLGAANGPVTLGAAWSAPPAMLQPPAFETAYTAICHPAGRGDGQIADDVYALGVLLLTLALGRVPMADIDDLAIISRKLDLGDAATLMSGEHLPPMLADLIRAMLAEDPDHRPSPALLRDPASARGRRLTARPPVRAARPLALGAIQAWNTKTLALGMAANTGDAANAIQNGTLMHWLRRAVGESALAAKLEELSRLSTQDGGADKTVASATLTMRAIAAADGRMPLCWQGLAFFPDGLGPLLTLDEGREPGVTGRLFDLIMTEAIGTWSAMRDDGALAGQIRLDARRYRAIVQIKGMAGGMPRLTYALNPLSPCASALLNGRWIALIDDLPQALDAIAAAEPETALLDSPIAAFIGAHADGGLEQAVKTLTGDGQPGDRVMSFLQLLSALQDRYHPKPLRGLTAWIAARAAPLSARWHNKDRRAGVEAKLKALADAGHLSPILALLRDEAGQAADADGLQTARMELARLDAVLGAIMGGGALRAAAATRLGQEIAAGAGLAAAAVAVILAVWG